MALRVTPFTVVKPPPIHTEVPSERTDQTSPLTSGAKLVLITPVVALKAKTLERGYWTVRLEFSTSSKLPPTTIWLPASSIA